MRKNEGDEVRGRICEVGHKLRPRQRRGAFPQQALTACEDPEDKRKIIGAEFIRVF